MAKNYIIVSRDFYKDGRPGYFCFSRIGGAFTRNRSMAWVFSTRSAASEANIEGAAKDPLWPETEIVES